MRLCQLVLLLTALTCGSCGVNKPPAKKYSMHGKVISLDEQSHLAKINAGQIGDWMSPMTMDYSVPNQSDWKILRAGKEIDASVYVRGDEFWVADVHSSGLPVGVPAQ